MSPKRPENLRRRRSLALFFAPILCGAPVSAKTTSPRTKDANALITEAAYLVSQQDGKPVDEVRALDKRLERLEDRFAKLGTGAVGPLAKAALDEKEDVRTRLWLVLYLQSVQDVTAFPSLRRLTLDASQPDTLRDAAARALAANPVNKAARSRALCAALDREPGPQLRLEALFELSRLGCEDPRPLERLAEEAGARPEGRAATEAGHAIAALSRSAPPSAVDALDRLLRKYATGAPQRGRALDALTRRAAQLKLDLPRWSARAAELLREESRDPDNAAAALRLIAALGDPASAPLAARYLGDPDPRVVVAAAETLAALRARDHAAAVAAVYDGYYTDARFANRPGVDPVALYDRLAAALKALK